MSEEKNLPHAEQLEKLQEVIRQNQEFIRNSIRHPTQPSDEDPLVVRNLKENTGSSEFV